MKQTFLFLISCLTLVALTFPVPAMADDAELLSIIKNMQKRMDAQDRKIQMLENRGESIPMAPSGGEATAPMSDYEFNQRLDAATGGAQKWLKDLKFSGDLRLRYEGFHYNSGNPAETDDRNRFRYRLRYGFEKKFNEDLSVGFGLASGEVSTATGNNVDPTSTNQSFDGDFNFKPIFTEKAWAKYTPGFLKNKGPVKQTEIGAGKVNNPFEKGSSDMVWDRDVKPEGIYEKIDFNLLDGENLDLAAYVTAGQFVLDEDTAVGGDANLFAYQLGLNPTFYTPLLERSVDLLQAVSFYDYSNYARVSNFTVNGTAMSGSPRGNTNTDANAAELDAGKFKVFESYSELGMTPFGLPTRLFFDFATNPADAASVILREKYAFAFGTKFGSIVKKGDWELGYAYKQIGADAVVGAFNDSDFGDGHSGKRGHVFKGAYALLDNLTLNGAMVIVENLNAGTGGILDQQQRRFQVDLSWKF